MINRCGGAACSSGLASIWKTFETLDGGLYDSKSKKCWLLDFKDNVIYDDVAASGTFEDQIIIRHLDLLIKIQITLLNHLFKSRAILALDSLRISNTTVNFHVEKQEEMKDVLFLLKRKIVPRNYELVPKSGHFCPNSGDHILMIQKSGLTISSSVSHHIQSSRKGRKLIKWL